jgi:hypothetical protein
MENFSDDKTFPHSDRGFGPGNGQRHASVGQDLCLLL